MEQPPPIPEPYWREIKAFLQAKKTGQIRLHIVRGRVVGLDVTTMTRQQDARGARERRD